MSRIFCEHCGKTGHTVRTWQDDTYCQGARFFVWSFETGRVECKTREQQSRLWESVQGDPYATKWEQPVTYREG